MIERELVVSNRLGLHARATAKLVQVLSAYRCNATLSSRGRDVNAKSIMGVMLLAAGKGTPVLLRVDGDDEVEAVTMPDGLIAFVREFVDRHHVEEPFYKRKRKPYDPRKGSAPPRQRPGSDGHE